MFHVEHFCGAYMKLTIASIAPRSASGATQALFEQYHERLAAYTPVEAQIFRSEPALLEALARQRARTDPFVVLLDSRGKLLPSEAWAQVIDQERSSGRQSAVFAIGPSDGWTEAARSRASLLLSLGPITLPHELARVILAEQLYRAHTILAGHPYHSGH